MNSDYVDRSLIGAREHAAWRYACAQCARHRIERPARWRGFAGFLSDVGPLPSPGHRLALAVVGGLPVAAWSVAP